MKNLFLKLYKHLASFSIFYLLGLSALWAYLNSHFFHYNQNRVDDWALIAISIPFVLFLVIGLPFYDKYKPVPPPEPIVLPLNINETARLHHQWIVEMGWTKEKTSPLEQLALISSEVGEAVNEARGKELTENFKYEVADIVLRCFSLAERYDIDLEKTIAEKMEKNRARGNKGRIK